MPDCVIYRNSEPQYRLTAAYAYFTLPFKGIRFYGTDAMSRALHELRNEDNVLEIKRGVKTDWVITVRPTDGPIPNPARVFCHHARRYDIVEWKHDTDNGVKRVFIEEV